MKNQKKAELKVGIAVIVSIVILLWILGWAKNFSFSSNEKTLSISFQNVAGLSIGDLVSVQGIKEGYVKNLYNKDNYVIVDVSISDNLNLKSDAQFSIMMLDLMGGKKIEIAPGVSDFVLDYTQVQKGQFVGDISTAMAALGSMQNDLITVVGEVKLTLSSMNKILNNSEFIGDLQSSVASLNLLIQKTDKIISDNSKSFSELLKNSNEFVSNSNDFVLENKDDIKTSLNDIGGLVKNTDTLMLKLNNFFTEVKDQDNNLGKLIYDKELVDNLSETIKKIKELSNTINKQLNEKGLKVDAYIF